MAESIGVLKIAMANMKSMLHKEDDTMNIKDWNIEAMTGYKPITTFYTDFPIADAFGVEAIKDTYNRALEGWKDDYKYITELYMVLNWKIWEHYETNEAYGELYNELWEKLEMWVDENFNKEEKSYFYRTTD